MAVTPREPCLCGADDCHRCYPDRDICHGNWRTCPCSECRETRVEYADHMMDKIRDDRMTGDT